MVRQRADGAVWSEQFVDVDVVVVATMIDIEDARPSSAAPSVPGQCSLSSTLPSS